MTGAAIAGATPSAGGHEIPALRTDHLHTLIDDVGIVQHARWSIPLRSSGYCVDDVARLVQVGRLLAEVTADPGWSAVIRRCLAFLWHAADGAATGMRNLMSYDRRWLDEPSLGDHAGRTIWALGELLEAGQPPSIGEPAAALVERLGRQLAGTRPSAHTAAYALLGLAADDALRARHHRLVDQLADQLVALHRTHARPHWDWFEPALRYDGARLSQALLVAGHRTDRPALTEVGLRTLRWYGDQCRVGDTLRLPGNAGRGRGQPHPGSGDEQPLDAAALTEAELVACEATGDAEHDDRAQAAFAWFIGRNHLGAMLYDPGTGGCRDGLGPDHVNANQGAESTLAYHTARLRLAPRQPMI